MHSWFAPGIPSSRREEVDPEDEILGNNQWWRQSLRTYSSPSSSPPPARQSKSARMRPASCRMETKRPERPPRAASARQATSAAHTMADTSLAAGA
eukprot:1233801-Pyramimonas_sp.AAC.1